MPCVHLDSQQPCPVIKDLDLMNEPMALPEVKYIQGSSRFYYPPNHEGLGPRFLAVVANGVTQTAIPPYTPHRICPVMKLPGVGVL